MSHQDPTSLTPPNRHHQDLRVVLDWLLEHADFTAVGFRSTCTWTPRSLTVAALLWAWSAEETLTARFTAARKIAHATLGLDTLTAATSVTIGDLAIFFSLRRRLQAIASAT